MSIPTYSQMTSRNTPVASDAQKTMSTREIAELTGKEHKNVLADARKMLEELGFATAEFSAVYLSDNGQSYEHFLLPRDLTTTLVSGYSIKMRHAIVKRWMELEAKAAAPAFAMPTNLLEAGKLWVGEMEAHAVTTATLAIAAPKAVAFDKFADGAGCFGFRDVAKTLQIKEPTLRAFLVAIGMMYQLGGTWVPYADQIAAKRMIVRKGTADNGKAFTRALFTPSGVAWLTGQWMEYATARTHKPGILC